MPLQRQTVAPVALAVLGVAVFASSPALAGSERVTADGELLAYDPALAGARATLRAEYDAAGDSRLAFAVTGLASSAHYVVRAHAGGCPATPAELGEVFQMSPNPDPEHPEDPDFRNGANEVWLDVETEADGSGASEAVQPWQFSPIWRAGSVVVHAVLPITRPHDPVVGRALGCLEVAF